MKYFNEKFKRRLKLFFVCVCFFSVSFSAFGCGRGGAPVGDIMKVNLTNGKILQYLNAETPAEQYSVLKQYSNASLDSQNLGFTWLPVGKECGYKLFFSENKDYSDAYVTFTDKTIWKGGIFYPEKRYYCKVLTVNDETDMFVYDNSSPKESTVIKELVIETENETVRYVDIEGVSNVRDMGGWKTQNGKEVRYGMIYRGGAFSNLTENGKNALRYLKVKSEIDLRGTDNGGQTECAWDKNLIYLQTPITCYSYIIPEFKRYSAALGRTRSYDTQTKYSLNWLFGLLSKEENYPVYFHCSMGADRTGTIAFLINGLLGVSFADLTKDFEITTFSRYGARLRGPDDPENFTFGIMQDDANNYVAWGELYDLIMKHYGDESGDLSFAVANYLEKTCGITTEQISEVKRIMLK